MIKDYFLLAFRNLKHRGLRSWLTMLGIFIGIAAVVSLISLGSGLETAVTGQFGALSVDKLTIQNKGAGFGPPGSSVVNKLNDHDVKVIEGVRGVDKVITRNIRVVKIEYNKASMVTYVVDVPNNQEDINLIYDSFSMEAKEGRLLKAGDTKKVLLGSEVAGTKQFDKELRVGAKIKINGEDFEIVGILKRISSFQVNSVVLMPHDDLEDLLNIKDEYDIIVAQVQDKDKIEQVATDIENALRKDRNEKVGEEDFTVQTPLQALSSVNTILNIINLIVTGIAMISLVVGGVGITNTMYTSTLERKKEIGTMKALGARNSDILWIFIIESGLLGLVGGIVGALMGLGAAMGIASIANGALGENLFVIAINYPLLIGSVSFAFLVGIISGVIPALQASKLKPVDALRG